MTATALRHSALALAAPHQALLLDAHRLAAAVAGLHGRRRAGPGEAFWQYRDHQPQDGARLVDWRRSARGERLYVKEREFEAAQAAFLWADPSPGFDWRGAKSRPTKRQRAQAIALAFGLLALRGGERVGLLGEPARRGVTALPRLCARWLSRPDPVAPNHAPARSVVVLATDGFAPIAQLEAQIAPITARGASGALLLVTDPAEEEFPFSGRVRFEAVDNARDGLTLGRAEMARDAYLERLTAHRVALAGLAERHGLILVRHRTDAAAATPLALLVAALQERKR